MNHTFNNSKFSVSHLDDQELNELINLIEKEKKERKEDNRAKLIDNFREAYNALKAAGFTIKIDTFNLTYSIDYFGDFKIR